MKLDVETCVAEVGTRLNVYIARAQTLLLTSYKVQACEAIYLYNTKREIRFLNKILFS